MIEQIFFGLVLFVIGVFIMGMVAVMLVVLYELGRMVVRKVHDRIFRGRLR